MHNDDITKMANYTGYVGFWKQLMELLAEDEPEDLES